MYQVIRGDRSQPNSKELMRHYLLQPVLCAAEAYDYIKIIGGSSNKALAEEIGNRLGVGAGECKLGRYADGEISISLDEHVRGKVSLAGNTCSKLANACAVSLFIVVYSTRMLTRCKY
jgi:phosphoribosylpyrophosphate synthetase